MACDVWRVACGGWWVACGGWRVACGFRIVDCGSWIGTGFLHASREEPLLFVLPILTGNTTP